MSAAALIDAGEARGLTVATAESCTGGLVAAAITEVAGASQVYERGWVTYTNRAKEEDLGVRPETLSVHGAVSEEVAAEMAAGARSRAGTDIAVAVTGIAGPGGSEHKPEGRVCFGLASPDGVRTQTVEFGPIGRAHVRARSVAHALGLLLEAVEDLNGPTR